MKIIIPCAIFLMANIGFAQTAGQLLERAYKMRSSGKLNRFFQNWQKGIATVSNDELARMNDTTRQAYYAFRSFYKPLNLDSLGGSEWGNNIYKNVKYLILQNNIRVYFTCRKFYYTEQEKDDYIVKHINENIKEDSTRQKLLARIDGKLAASVLEYYDPLNQVPYGRNDTLIDSIANFRPQINCSRKQAVYLTPEYNTLLSEFLGNQHSSLGTNGIMNPAKAKNESAKRKRFLERYVKIWYGHWGGYWQLNSYPKASSITFDREMKYAKIDFRMVYEGGEAILENKNGQWVMISAKRTWIE